MRILFFMIVWMFIGCKSSKEGAKFYKSYNRETRSSRALTLNEDYTFDYKHNVGLISSYSKGTWSLKGDSLLIRSNKTYRNGFIEIEVNDQTSIKDSIVIAVVLKQEQVPITSAIVTIGSLDVYSVTDEMGKVVVKSNPFSKLTLSFLGRVYNYKSEEKIDKNIKIILTEEYLSKTYFDSEKWVKKGNKIISSDDIVFKLKKH